MLCHEILQSCAPYKELSYSELNALVIGDELSNKHLAYVQLCIKAKEIEGDQDFINRLPDEIKQLPESEIKQAIAGIPEGHYCYRIKGYGMQDGMPVLRIHNCPHYQIDEDNEAYCPFVRDAQSTLLFDSIKECGIKTL